MAGILKRWQVIVILAIIAVLGGIVLVRSRAATQPVMIEAEKGTTSGVVRTVTDASASGGSAVLFHNPSDCIDAPTAPTDFAGSPTMKPSIELSWTASTPAPHCALKGYRFWRATGKTPPPMTGTPYADALVSGKYSNTKVDFSTTYSYTLVAYDTAGHVSQPVTLTATTPPSGWIWPVHKEDLASQTAGLSQCWLHYYSPRDSYHAALDIRVSYKPVYAPHKGTVVEKYNDGYNTLIINTGKNVATGKTLYAVFEHMSVITVNVGDTVTQGERIGTSGEVGAPNAPHLHFGISDSISAFGTYANPWHTANPLDFLPNDYSPALLTNGSYSCKTNTIESRSDYGFAQYKTYGTFDMYK